MFLIENCETVPKSFRDGANGIRDIRKFVPQFSSQESINSSTLEIFDVYFQQVENINERIYVAFAHMKINMLKLFVSDKRMAVKGLNST